MKMSSKFIISLLVFSIAVALLFYFIEPLFSPKASFSSFWMIQLIMIVATFLFHYGLTRSSGNPQGFVRYFIGATSVKLLVFMIIMVMYGLTHKDAAFGFILHFFIFYLLYTIFEVVASYKEFSLVRNKK